MRRWLPILVLLSLAPCASPLGAQELRCNPEGSQAEMNVCAADDFEKADRELNDVYRDLLEKRGGDKLFITKLKAAQRAWVAFRDADLEAAFACADGDPRICFGSMHPLCYYGRKTELTEQRTTQLRSLLADDGCP